jgi:hypothetical protein
MILPSLCVQDDVLASWWGIGEVEDMSSKKGKFVIDSLSSIANPNECRSII